MGLNWNEIKSRALLFSKTWADACNEDSQAKSEHSQRALQGYADNPITLGILGKLLGRSVIDMVSGWPADAPPLFVCSGTKEQREAPTALAKRWTVRMDGVPLPLSMLAITLWVVHIRAAT